MKYGKISEISLLKGRSGNPDAKLLRGLALHGIFHVDTVRVT